MKILFLLVNENNIIILDDLLLHGFEVDVILPRKSAGFEAIKLKTNDYKNRWISDNIEKTIDQLAGQNSYACIFPAFYDGSCLTIAGLNKKHNFFGLHPHTASCIHGKENYYKMWQQLGIPYPETYFTVASGDTINQIPAHTKFPCIVKPSIGAASVGIQIIENQQSLIDFFADTDIKVSKYQEQHGDAYKQLQYQSMQHCYIVQQFIKGPVVSFMGVVHNGQVQIDFVFDIESTSYPYVAETGLQYPSAHISADLESQVHAYLDLFFKNIKFDNSAFMLDIIIDPFGKIMFIDFAPRLSVSHIILWHAGEKNYGSKLMNKLIHGIDYTLTTDKKVLFRQLPFKKKEIKHIEVKQKHLADVVSLPKGKIQQVRNDMSVYHNGWAIFTGETTEIVEEKYHNFVSGMIVEYCCKTTTE